MHDLLFENQQALEDEDLAQYATGLGLDAERLIREVLSGQHQARVKEDFKTGTRAGVNGTFATTTGTFLSGPTASFFTRATSAAGTGPFGANSLLIGIGWVGQVC